MFFVGEPMRLVLVSFRTVLPSPDARIARRNDFCHFPVLRTIQAFLPFFERRCKGTTYFLTVQAFFGKNHQNML